MLVYVSKHQAVQQRVQLACCQPAVFIGRLGCMSIGSRMVLCVGHELHVDYGLLDPCSMRSCVDSFAQELMCCSA